MGTNEVLEDLNIAFIILFAAVHLCFLVSNFLDNKRVKSKLDHVLTCYSIIIFLLSIQWMTGAFYDPFGAHSMDDLCRGMAYFSGFAWYLAHTFAMGVTYCYYRYFKKKIKASLTDKSHQITITKAESSEANLTRDNLETTVQEYTSREESAEKTEPQGINLEATVAELATNQEEKATVQEQPQAEELDRIDSLGIKCDEKPPNEIEEKTEECPPEGFWAVYLLCTGVGLTEGLISALIEGHDAKIVAKCSIFWDEKFVQIGACLVVINYSTYTIFNAYVYGDLRRERKIYGIYGIKDPHLNIFLRIFTVFLGVTIAFGFIMVFIFKVVSVNMLDEYLLVVLFVHSIFALLQNLTLTIFRKIDLNRNSEKQPCPDISRQNENNQRKVTKSSSVWDCFKRKRGSDQNKSGIGLTVPLVLEDNNC